MSRVLFRVEDIKNAEVRRKVEERLRECPSLTHASVGERSDGGAPSPVAARDTDAADAKFGGVSRKAKKRTPGPNKTEERFNREMLGGSGVFEGLTFRLPGGSRYTPDWIYTGWSGQLFAVEVKGAHRFPSEGRALTAFREARAAWPSVVFVWFRWDGKKWEERHCEGTK